MTIKNNKDHVLIRSDYECNLEKFSKLDYAHQIINGDDYFELYARCQTNSGNNPVVQGHGGRVTFFGATRIAGLTS